MYDRVYTPYVLLFFRIWNVTGIFIFISKKTMEYSKNNICHIDVIFRNSIRNLCESVLNEMDNLVIMKKGL